MAYNVLSGTITRLPIGAIAITGSFTGDGSALDNTPGPDTTTNADNNRLTTFTSTSGKTLNGEENLTFDGSLLSVTGHLTASQGVSASYFLGDGSKLTGITGGGGNADAQGPIGSLQFNTGSGGISGSAQLSWSYGGQNLLVSGGLALKRVAIATHHTASSNEYFLGIDSRDAPVSIMVDAALFIDGQTLVIKDEYGSASVNRIIITGSGTQRFDGDDTYIVLESPYASVNIYSNGAEKWFIY